MPRIATALALRRLTRIMQYDRWMLRACLRPFLPRRRDAAGQTALLHYRISPLGMLARGKATGGLGGGVTTLPHLSSGPCTSEICANPPMRRISLRHDHQPSCCCRLSTYSWISGTRFYNWNQFMHPTIIIGLIVYSAGSNMSKLTFLYSGFPRPVLCCVTKR